jgi:transposase
MTKSMQVYKRRLKVKEMYLKEMSISDIANKLQVSDNVIRTDIRAINKEYLAQVQKNPHILEKQAEYILKHLDEMKLIKQKLWEIEKSADSDKNEIASLKALLDVLGHEARVLKLIDVSKTINNYIHVEKIGILVNGAIEVIREFVPLDKQKYALERLKTLGNNIIDVKPGEK